MSANRPRVAIPTQLGVGLFEYPSDALPRLWTGFCRKVGI